MGATQPYPLKIAQPSSISLIDMISSIELLASPEPNLAYTHCPLILVPAQRTWSRMNAEGTAGALLIQTLFMDPLFSLSDRIIYELGSYSLMSLVPVQTRDDHPRST